MPAEWTPVLSKLQGISPTAASVWMEEHRTSVKRAKLDTQDARPDADPASGSVPESSGVVHRAPAQPPQPGTQFFIRDENFWFEDGNIILAARSVGFKVYKGLLAEHSTVFRSMFVVAQGAHAAGEQAPDGCPVVPLDDSPEDLRQLFRLIYPLTSNIR